ncbi:MAG: tRNA (adenosine(37)-N6)-threonylcarbamoyltransferase complex ATPase subunit type 1 TsaE [Flavobacteriales bacterium]|nr:tRNA (adenosine(37)-N6)-threonylcarbamoyltransferase complex ATPase subunit type 1 TsaE [Flavobacteriales bacterium]
MHHFSVDTIEDLTPVAEELIQFSKRYPIILLQGEMGTGKTTLSRVLVQQAGGSHPSSPTFSLVNPYETDLGTIYHFDLYRIEDPEELLDFGFEEYLDSGDICLIEWPAIASSLIDPPYIGVELKLGQGTSRSIEIHQVDA